MRKYLVVYEKSKDGYSAYVPDGVAQTCRAVPVQGVIVKKLRRTLSRRLTYT